MDTRQLRTPQRSSRTRLCKPHLKQRGQPVKHTSGARESSRGLLTVDTTVDPLVRRVDRLAVLFGINIDLGFVCGDKLVELRIEDSDDLGALVIHDRLVLLVPEHGDGEPICGGWGCYETCSFGRSEEP